MYCPKCGCEAGDYTRICPGCGELLEGDSTPAQHPVQSNQNNDYNTHYNTTSAPAPAPAMPQVPDYKIQSILLIVFSSILCCFDCISILALPFAIVALVQSNKISAHITAGNVGLAQEASQKTKMWCWVSFGILLGTVILYIVYLVYIFSTGIYQNFLDQYMDILDEFSY